MLPMENSLPPSRVVIAYDATKNHGLNELIQTIGSIRTRDDILHNGDTLVVLGVLHKLPSPIGINVRACPDSFIGASTRAVEEEVRVKVDVYLNMLLPCAEICDDAGVSIEVKITAGTPIKQVVFQEVVDHNATWVVLDRFFRKDSKFYQKHLPCKVALIQENLPLQILKNDMNHEADAIDHKPYYSRSKSVPVFRTLGSEHSYNGSQSIISFQSFSFTSGSTESFDALKTIKSFPSSSHRHQRDPLEQRTPVPKPNRSGTHNREENKQSASNRTIQNHKRNVKSSQQRNSGAPILCYACGARTELFLKDTMRFSFSEIQQATDNFSKDNLLGEGGYGHVYKGELKGGQRIAAKVRKEASTQGFSEFHSEVYVLNFARHRNIVMLLGYCCKENLNILVYEYICNKSLDWHLFDNKESVLEWNQRHAIAIGTAKGLRFLHEECRGGPIIHRDLRPSNILLTHDYVPMIGDFGLARWRKTDEEFIQTRILGTLGYLAPEYAENGIVSVGTDVYAFGIVLLQLISGRKVVDSRREDGLQSLRQWAEPLLENLVLHELIDPRITDSYDVHELYLMAMTAYLCVRQNPEMRPSMGEVVQLLEGRNERIHDFREQFAPSTR